MSNASPPLLPELPEAQATGRIAAIYAEIRRFSGVPYVSSLQRYLATLPGVLDWAWSALRPAMASGDHRGNRLAPGTRHPAAAAPARFRRRSCAEWGVDAAGLAAIRNIAANFVRVAPVNIVTGACLSRLLTGAPPSGSGFSGTWTPPAMLPPMPGNVDPARLCRTPQRGGADALRHGGGGTPFIPALYRQVAHWPAALAWLADELAPRFTAPETAAQRARFQAATRDAAPDIVARCPGFPAAHGPTTQRTGACWPPSIAMRRPARR